MVPGAELGDCEPIIPSSQGGYKTAGEKNPDCAQNKVSKVCRKERLPCHLIRSYGNK